MPARVPTLARPALAAATLAAALAAAAMTGGCSVIESDNHVSYTGNYVPTDSFSRIEVGRSTPAFVEATLGEPTSRTDLEDGTQIWRWDYVVRRSGEGSLLLVFDGQSSSEKRHASFVQFQDGVVVKKWRS